MENWDIVSVTCLRDYDPKIVRVRVKVSTTIFYDVDIPEPLYPDIGAALGWPTNPCTEA